MRQLLLFLFSVSAAFGAQAFVQNGPTTCTGTSGNIACVITGTTSGNTLHIGLGYRTNTATDVTSVTGSLGTPAQIAAANPGSQTGAWLYCETLTSSGTETITVTMNGTYFFGNITIQEFSGSTCTSDGTSNNSTNASNPTCGTFTPGTANTIVAAVVYANMTNNDLAAVAGYTTNALILNNGGSTRSSGMEYKIETSIQAESPTWTASAGLYSCAAAALKTAAVARVRHRVINQ